MKKIIALLLATLMVFSMVACSSSSSKDEYDIDVDHESGVPVVAEGEEVVINFIFKHMANVYWELAAEGAQQAAADMGFTVNVLAPITNGSNDEQVELLEQSIAQGVDAIVIAVNDTDAIVPTCEAVMDAGIALVSFSTAPADGTYDAYVGIENYDIGQLMTADLCDRGNNEGTAIILEGPLGQQNSIDRAAGAADMFAERGVEVVSQQSANWARTEALTLVQSILQENPDIKYIFCCNDEMALGAAEAVSQAGKSGVLISGVDAGSEALDAVESGALASSCYQDPYGQAYTSAMLALQILAGDEVEKDNVLQGVAVTIDNLDEYR